jgi:hypothetical protein
LDFGDEILFGGRTEQLVFAVFEDDGDPLPIESTDVIRAKLFSMTDEAVDTLELDVSSKVAEQLAGGSRVSIESLGQSLTPSSTDANTDVITFGASHGWATGTRVYATATAGGLQTGLAYYVRAASATTITLHPTAGDATANANTVDLTASITAAIVEPASGVVIFAQADTASLDAGRYWLSLVLSDDSETNPANAAKEFGRGRINLRASPAGNLGV